MWVLGIDENGLGPRLGPLTTTAVALEIDAYADVKHWHAVGERLGIDDSKAKAGFKKMAFAEGLALALAYRLSGKVITHANELLDWITSEKSSGLQALCPESSKAQCWKEYVRLPILGGRLENGLKTLDSLAAHGVGVRAARTKLACARSLNLQMKYATKLDVDLWQAEQLMIEMRAPLLEDMVVICGMIGGIRHYVPRFKKFVGPSIRIEKEQKGCSKYFVDGMGTVSFEVDADSHHLPVSLASLLGKYVRELSMYRQNAFYRDYDHSLQEVSGYHDPNTQAFIQASQLLRKRLGVDDLCFERVR